MTPPPPTSILIIGAGELGTAILAALAAHPAYTTHPHPPKLALLRRLSTLTSTDPATVTSLTALTARGITLEPGDFTSTPESWGRVVRELGAWGNTVTVTDVEGIGRAVAEVVFEPEGTEDRVVYVAGDTLSYGEVADVVEAGFGGGFKRELWDREFLRKRLEEEPEDLMLKYQNAFGAGVGVSWEMERTLNYQRGLKLTDLRKYVEDNKEQLLAAAAE
ncbi:hypothetical protein CHGG_07489 [Chaetomium globosum CBS 148.51]|uniref:NmrA-like domain-containing protein n=1 Tax=Chaetomium globosum (strain ATCC 6205 / CBS 148.51 / DSM 1962 / NBRC 6347 / NRRL 1970) TaxID=306901 RepID=Q2GX15_CHAGB|nr:uncharacterized protein CHGG_07489 [Chaetomium globosum CBS 148.51]EAQ86236.1 hypothetical protein CHGG_07489 [Chaetomium globosum CBS 148.51]